MRPVTERSRFTVDAVLTDLAEFFERIDATNLEVHAATTLDVGDLLVVRGSFRLVREADAPDLSPAEADALLNVVEGENGVGQLRGVRRHLKALEAKGLLRFDVGWYLTSDGRFERRLREANAVAAPRRSP